MFHHNFLPKLELQRIDSPNGRKYTTPEGNSYQSVTTFLKTLGNDEIQKWRDAVGEAEANRISKQAATRGTLLHEHLEHLILNQEVPVTNRLVKSMYTPFAKSLRENVSNVRALEYPLYSDIFKLAGTIDLCADWQGVPSIIDFKTSKKHKDKFEIENYFLQATIYSYMMEERYGVKCSQLVILIGVEYMNRIQVFVEDRKNFRDRLITLIKERKHE